MTNTNISELYTHLKTLIKQYTYDKNEIDTALNGKAYLSHIHDTDDVYDDSAYANLNVQAFSSQSQINNAIDVRIGNVISILVGTGQ